MATPDGDEDFEFLVNLLASDGADPDRRDPPPLRTTGSHQTINHGLRFQRGPGGKLDLGQVRTFYESKNTASMGAGVGVGTSGTRENPVSTDQPRNSSEKGGSDIELAFEADISVSRSVSDREGQTGPQAPPSHDTDTPSDFQGHIQDPASSPTVDSPGRWVDMLSDREAKQLLLEISDALKLKLPLDDDPGSAPGRPRTLGEVKNIVEFLVEMDELVWRRSEHGADRGVFDSKNISAVGERIRLWEKIARGHGSD